MFEASHYFIFGTILSLALITYSDFKTLKIDDRRNWFMQGYTLALALMSNVVLFYVIITLSMFLMIKLLTTLETKTKQVIFGAGDTKLLQWLVPGFVILGLIMPAVFSVSLMFVLIGLVITKHYFKDFSKQPGTVFITMAFLITWGVYALIF